MKKLLSLLSVLTISGSAVPTTIAASSYQKQEKVNQLENIGKRQKRSNNENNKINKTKVVIKTDGENFSSGVTFNNKLYFGSRDGNVYEYDPATEQQKIVIRTNGKIESSGVVLNNKVYFGSLDTNVYEYDPATEQQKIAFTTNGKIESSGVVLNNKVYFGSRDNNVYEYDRATEQQKIVIRTNGWVWSSGLVLNNKLYFGSWDHNVYEYNPVTGQQKIVITTNNNVTSSGIVFNNKLYFGSWDHNVYEYNPVTGQQKIALTANNIVDSSGIIFNNKLYFGSHDHNVYEYDPNYYNLGKIHDNSDNVILNELNYLNPDLNISQLKIINKTNTSATIKSKDNKYFDEFTVNYKIKNKDEINSIDLNELIKKALFFKFRDENHNLKFKKINNIATNNLNFGNIEVSRNSELLHSIYFKDVCFDKKGFVNFNLKYAQKYSIDKCEYNTKSKIIFQIITGLNKTNKKNELNGWNINLSLDDEIKLSDFISINNKDSEFIYTLSDSFDLSNINKQEQEMILHSFNEGEYEISIDPKTKLEIVYSVREINLETILNLKQKITGTITAKITYDNNEEQIITLSIKEAMQILQKYSLLPDEIIINEDNGITFNGKAKISLTQETEPKLITKISSI